MKRSLVTGGAGFIGSHIAEALVGRGTEVRVLDNLSTGHFANLGSIADRIELLRGDVTDPDMVAQAVEGVDCVFHQAALASVPLSLENPLATHETCVTGTLQLLEAARRAGVRRFVYAASSSCYGDSPAPVKREDQPTMAISPYGAAKLAGELYLQSYFHSFGMETVALRYFNVFGPRQDPASPYSAVIPIFISRMLNGESPIVHGDGRQSRDFVYVEDVVQANLRAASATGAGGRSFNVGRGQSLELVTLIGLLNRLLGCDIPARHVAPRAGDIRESLADISLAREVLGYQPQVTFEEGLRRSIDYYRSIVG